MGAAHLPHKTVIDVHRKLVRLPGCEVNAAASPRERCVELFDWRPSSVDSLARV